MTFKEWIQEQEEAAIEALVEIDDDVEASELLSQIAFYQELLVSMGVN